MCGYCSSCLANTWQALWLTGWHPLVCQAIIQNLAFRHYLGLDGE